MTERSVRIALVGLGFGAHWIEAYVRHPDVARVGLCDENEELLARVGDEHGIESRHISLEEVLASDDYDAVHLFTGIPDHGRQSLRVLRSGKHCASAIPMAVVPDEPASLVAAERESGLSYMLMETECWSATYLHVKRLYESGAFGALQFLRAWHYQNMEGWPGYWQGLPPMFYSFHGLGPIMDLHGRRAVRVQALGSGTRLADAAGRYGNPFPIETALFQFEGLDAVCETTVCLYRMARGFSSDRFAVYGDRMGFESAQFEGDPPVFFDAEDGPLAPGRRGRPIRGRRGVVPPLEALVDPSCRAYVAGLGRSRRFGPLVHEFVRSIVERRPSAVNARVAARWTSAAFAAHESALRGGVPVDIPDIPENAAGASA